MLWSLGSNLRAQMVELACCLGGAMTNATPSPTPRSGLLFQDVLALGNHAGIHARFTCLPGFPVNKKMQVSMIHDWEGPLEPRRSTSWTN